MKKALIEGLTLLGEMLMASWIIINATGGVVGGIWLVLSGGFYLVLFGIIASLIMPYAYVIVTLPTMLFAFLIGKCAESKKSAIAAILAFIVTVYEKFVIATWAVFIFAYYWSYSDTFSVFPLILCAYATIMSPLGHMAKGEDENAVGTVIGLLFAIIVFALLCVAFVLGIPELVNYIWLLVLGSGLLSVYLVGHIHQTSQIQDTASSLNHQSGPQINNQELSPQKLFCKKCGHGIISSAAFCNSCGGKL